MQFGSGASELASDKRGSAAPAPDPRVSPLSVTVWPIPAPDFGIPPSSVGVGSVVGGGCLFVCTRESVLLTMRVGVGVAVVVTVVSSSALSPSRSPAMSPSGSPSDSPAVPA